MKNAFDGSSPAAGSDEVSIAALNDRIERLEMVLRATEEGLFEWNIETGEVYYSPRWKAMLGFADDEFPNTTREWQQRVHPDDLDHALQVIRDYLAGRRDNCDLEHRLRHKDGSYRWIYERAVAERDADGTAIRLVGSHADITARKEAEAALVRRDAILEAVRFATERYLRNQVSWEENIHELLRVFGEALAVSRAYVFENAVDASGEVRSHQRYEWAAPGARPLIDYPVLDGFSYRDLGWERWLGVLGSGEPLAGPTASFPPGEQVELRNEGTESLAVVPIVVDGEWWGFVGFDDCVEARHWSSVEMDALKAAAGTLGAAIQRERSDAAAARLAAIVESTNDAIFGMLRNGTITSWNAAAERLLGYTEEEVLGQRIHMFLTPGEVERLRQVLVAIDGGEHLDRLQLEMARRDGSPVCVAMTFSLIRDASGEAVGTSAIARDISAQKRAEQDLQRGEAILEAVRFAAERFLDPDTTWEDDVQEVLGRLGTATGVSQVYVARAHNEDGETWTRDLHYWGAPGIAVARPPRDPRGVPLRASGLGGLADRLGRGDPAFGHTRNFPTRSARSRAERQGVVSWAIVPIFVEGEWWGVIGFDECEREREFSPSERDALMAAANTIGAAIAQQRAQERNAWLAAIVESSDDAVIGRTLDNRIVSWNQGAERLYGYRADEMVGHSIDGLLPPEERAAMAGILEAIRRGESVQHYETRRLHRDGTLREVSISFSPVRDASGSVIGSAAVSRDISARKRAESELRESQRSLSTLLSNLPGMAYRCRLARDWEMEFVSEGAIDLTGYRPADLVGNARLAYGDLIHPDDREMVWETVRAGVEGERPFRITYRIRTDGGGEKWVMEQGRAVPGAGPDQPAIEGIVTDVTERVLSRQELERRVEERTRELETLLEASATLASTLELRPLLGQILDQFGQVVEHKAAAIFLLDGEDELRLLDYRGPTPHDELAWVWSLADAAHSRAVIEGRAPVIIPDIRADTPMAAALRDKAVRDLGEVPGYIGSWMGVPLLFREQVIGVLAVDGAEVDAYTARDAGLALAFATQAAVAIVNARLYEQAQGTAALVERQRLARELHDSVSQALFGIGLGARTARTLLDEDPAKAAAPLDYVLSLAEAGLTEMRALIFELRPEALEQEGLVAALEKQAANVRARHGIAVEAELGDPGVVSLAVEEAVYRIVQEALNNTVKHARASTVTLRLAREAGRLVAEVMDDGAGFDPAATYQGHLGLRTMRERAVHLGGRVEIASAPGQGTRLRIDIPV